MLTITSGIAPAKGTLNSDSDRANRAPRESGALPPAAEPVRPPPPRPGRSRPGGRDRRLERVALGRATSVGLLGDPLGTLYAQLCFVAVPPCVIMLCCLFERAPGEGVPEITYDKCYR